MFIHEKTKSVAIQEPVVPQSTREERSYFRCWRLAATLSLSQCRLNREKPSFIETLLAGDVPDNVQPISCAACPLAKRVEQGLVRLYTAAEVLRGAVLRDPRESKRTPPQPHSG